MYVNSLALEIEWKCNDKYRKLEWTLVLDFEVVLLVFEMNFTMKGPRLLICMIIAFPMIGKFSFLVKNF